MRPQAAPGGDQVPQQVGGEPHVEPGEGNGEGHPVEHLVAEKAGVLVVAEGPAGAGADQFRTEREPDGGHEEDDGPSQPENRCAEGEHGQGAEDDVKRPGVLHPEIEGLAAQLGIRPQLRMGQRDQQPAEAEHQRGDVAGEEHAGDPGAGGHRVPPRTIERPRQTCSRRTALTSSWAATGRSTRSESQ